jgi:hypothetical protein
MKISLIATLYETSHISANSRSVYLSQMNPVCILTPFYFHIFLNTCITLQSTLCLPSDVFPSSFRTGSLRLYFYQIFHSCYVPGQFYSGFTRSNNVWWRAEIIILWAKHSYFFYLLLQSNSLSWNFSSWYYITKLPKKKLATKLLITVGTMQWFSSPFWFASFR